MKKQLFKGWEFECNQFLKRPKFSYKKFKDTKAFNKTKGEH